MEGGLSKEKFLLLFLTNFFFGGGGGHIATNSAIFNQSDGTSVRRASVGKVQCVCLQ